MSRRGNLPRLAAVLRAEGLAGLIGRVRYRPAPGHDVPAPALPDHVALRRHVSSPWGEAAAATLALAFRAIGVTLSPDDGRPASRPLLHLGLPAGPGVIGPGDLLMPGPGDATEQIAATPAALVLAHDPTHLARLESCAPGRPHVMAMPPMPGGEHVPTWRDWLAESAFHFQRLAIFCGRLAGDAADYRPILHERAQHDAPVRLCLTLPETPQRLNHFRQHGPRGFAPVHGLKLVPGWRGAAESYRQLARAALDLGLGTLTIAQDDLSPGPGFDGHLAAAHRLIAGGEADFFSGLVSDVTPALKVHRSHKVEGRHLVEYRHNVGLVLMIFGPDALRHLADWREGGVENTIDRHFSRAAHLRGLTMLPFPANHDPHLKSAVWSFRNARYDTMIRASERRLRRLVRRIERIS